MKTSLIMLVFVVASFLLGFLRDMLIAWNFGAGWLADALFVALMLPVFFENVLGIALRDALIPYLQRIRLQAATALRARLTRLQVGTWSGGIAVSLVIALGAPLWMALLVPGWSAAQIDQGTLAFRLGAALIAVQTVLYLQAAVLNVGGRFVLPLWRTLLYNLGGIVAMLAWPDSVAMVVLGMVLGQLLLLLVQQTVLRVPPALPGRQHENEPAAGEGSGRFLFHFMPLLVATGAQQLCVIAERLFASLLAEGSIAQLSFAFRIATIPLTLFALSFLTLYYPAFSTAWVKGDRERFVALLRHAASMTLIFLVPAAVVLAAQSSSVISLLLERGEFDAAQTASTAPLLALYAMGLPGMGLALLGGRVLLAQGRGRAFMCSALLFAGATLALDFLLYRSLGARGLALAFAVGSWGQALVIGGLILRLLPLAFSWSAMIRWCLAAGVVLGALLALPAPQSLAGLLAFCLLSLALHVASVALLGERTIFLRDFWRMAAVQDPLARNS